MPWRLFKGEVSPFSGQCQWLRALYPSSVQLGYYRNIWVAGAGSKCASETQDFYIPSLGLFLSLLHLVGK